MLALALSSLAFASKVVLLDPSESYFKPDENSQKSLSDIADLVSRTFYLDALNEFSHTSSLKLPLKTPTENIQVTLFGVKPSDLPSLQKLTSKASDLTLGHGDGLASTKLASALYRQHPNAKTVSVSGGQRTASLYNFQFKTTIASLVDAHNLEDLLTTKFWQPIDLSTLDHKVKEVEEFLQEMDLFVRSAKKFGTSSSDQPTFFYLTLDTFTALPDAFKQPALTVLDHVLSTILDAMPMASIGELIFSDTKVLANMALEHESAHFRRRRLLGNGSNGSDIVTVTSNLTYTVLYQNQMTYWFVIASILIIYFFSYCFAMMDYSSDQMLFTAFDAKWDNKRA